METEQALGQSPQVVAFDFDGTLTIQDSYTSFLRHRSGSSRYLSGLMTLLPELITYPVRRDRGRLKAAATRTFLAGQSATVVAEEARQFADEVWGRFMRPDALKCWEAWGRAGATRVIVTASPSLTVRPFADRLGADLLLGTELERVDDRLTGGFATPNCRAAEKVVRLRDAFGPGIRLAAAYGDTSGDTEMLAIADYRGWREFVERP
ncbi:MAG: HAD-IB family hydrolase [Caulobacterales bacterium]|nr:HAD-IB family hydrolase [Caulobacterales bacterium]